jgi:hypothetical protein
MYIYIIYVRMYVCAYMYISYVTVSYIYALCIIRHVIARDTYRVFRVYVAHELTAIYAPNMFAVPRELAAHEGRSLKRADCDLLPLERRKRDTRTCARATRRGRDRGKHDVVVVVVYGKKKD